MSERDPDDFIENHVKVYLERDVHGPWVVSGATVDGYPLDGLDDGDVTYLDDPSEEVKAGLNQLSLPNGKETCALLAAAVYREQIVDLIATFAKYQADLSLAHAANSLDGDAEVDFERLDEHARVLATEAIELLSEIIHPSPEV